MSDSVRPHREQPTRLPHPWDSPGKNTGVGCHFLLQCMKAKSESEVTQPCPTLRDPMDCSLPGSCIHGIFPGKSTGVGCHHLLRHVRLGFCKSPLSCLHRFSSEEPAFGGSLHDTEVIRGCTSALRMASDYPRVIETNSTSLG